MNALLLVSFGGPEGPADVAPFLDRVTAGRGIPAERLAEVASHYQRFEGVSPLNAHNRDLLAALQARLAPCPVYWGNRHAAPYLADAMRTMRADGIGRAYAFLTSPYGSLPGCRDYREELAAAAGGLEIVTLRRFYNHPGFLEPVADRVRSVLASVGPAAPLVFTAHSIPVAAAATSPYVPQLREAARLVADQVDPQRPWALVWQSRSGSGALPWLEPDVTEHLAGLAAQGVREAVLVPIGFVSDHMEVRYDLDVVAVEAAARRGLRVVRAATVGVDPRFVDMVAQLLAERMVGAPRRFLGTRGPSHDCCPAGCCPPARR